MSGNDLDERRSIYFPVIRVFFGFGSTREVCSPGAGEAIVELLAALLDTLQSESYLLRHLQEPGQNGSLSQVSAIFFPWVMGDTWVTIAHGSWVIHLLYSGGVQPMTHGSQTVVQPVTHGELAAHRPWAVQ